MAIQTREVLEKEVQRVGTSFNFIGGLGIIGVAISIMAIINGDLVFDARTIFFLAVESIQPILFFVAGSRMKKAPTASDIPVYLYIIIALTLYNTIRALLTSPIDFTDLGFVFAFTFNLLIIGYAIYALFAVLKLKKMPV